MVDRVGQRLGNYTLTRFIGRGAFADVYLGKHVHLNILAAIKVLQVRLVDQQHLEKFREEARIIASLIHPHIVRVFDFGVEGDAPFLVMDYAASGTMRNKHPRGECVAPEQVSIYLSQLASALQYAHNQRMIHRDVKPENMLLGQNGAALLSDFGLALIDHSSDSSTKETAGTIHYMAPEQLQGKPRFASDQYALAAVAYEWLTGVRPFSGASFAEIAYQHTTVPPLPLRDRNPSLPAAIDFVVLRGLRKDPALRFASIQEFADTFARACQIGQTSSVLPPPGNSTQSMSISSAGQHIFPTSAPGSDPLQLQSISEVQEQGQRISRRAIIVGLAALTATSIVVGSTALLLYPQTPPTPTVSTTPTPTPTATTRATATTTATASPRVQPTPSADHGSSTTSSPTATATPDPTSTPDPTPDPTATPDPTPTLGAILYSYTGHGTNAVNDVQWSPDGKRVASASNDMTVQIWDATTGGSVVRYTGHTGAVNGVGWSSKYQLIASCSGDSADKTVQVWDPTGNGNPKFTYQHTYGITCLAWSPDGQAITFGTDDYGVYLWYPITGNPTLVYSHSKTVNAVGWSPDGTYLASASDDGTASVWSLAAHKQYSSYTEHSKHPVNTLSWSPQRSSLLIATGGLDSTVKVWNAQSGTIMYTYLSGSSSLPGRVAWSPSGAFLAIAYDATASVWKYPSDTQSYSTMEPKNITVNAISWSSDNTRVVSCDVQGGVYVWQAI